MLPINRNPSARDLRSFARLWLPLFVFAIGAVLWFRFERPVAALAVWIAGAVVAAAALASQPIARRVFVGLMIATYPIGLVVSTLALAVLFYLVITPIGWVMRLAGRDPLRLADRTRASEWVPYHQNDDPKGAYRQF